MAWLPEAVLNQSQVILVVSDWESYLGSLGFTVYFVGDCSCLRVSVHQTGCIGFHVPFVVLYIYKLFHVSLFYIKEHE